jgi:hypothetical protein
MDYRDKPPKHRAWVKIQSAKSSQVGQDSTGVDNASFRVMPLPAPHRRSADLGAASNFHRGQPVSRMEDDPGALHMLERPAAVRDDRGQAREILGGNDHGNGLSHADRIARPAATVNPIFGSVH